MSRCLEDMYKDLEEIEVDMEPPRRVLEKLARKRRKLKHEITRYKLDNGLYFPMSELSKYAGLDVIVIEIIEKKPDGSLSTGNIYSNGNFMIDADGHLYYVSEYIGTIRYNKAFEKYIQYCGENRIEHDFVGFFGVELLDDSLEVMTVGSFNEDLEDEDDCF